MQNEVYNQALGLLQAASTPAGFTASVKPADNYQRVWTRDSALCGLAALSTGDDALVGTFRRSIETLLRHQHREGFVPSNVSVDESAVSYGGAVGRVDNHAWIVISACHYAFTTVKGAWLHTLEAQLQKSLRLMTAWEFNGRGLVYVPQSADWADEYHHHGYILYNQLLRLWALRCAARIFLDPYYEDEEQRVREAIETYYTPPYAYAPQTGRLLQEVDLPYWIMGFHTGAAYTQFDLLANALALLLGVGPAEKREATIEYIAQLYQKKEWLLPSFYPVVGEGDRAMEELKANYAFQFRNRPYEFHNGGLWPVWNGFLALCLAGEAEPLATSLEEAIGAACAIHNWEFNECFHGLTHEPIGVPQCSWSAAGYILAHNRHFKDKLII